MLPESANSNGLVLASIRATSRFGANRSASGMLVAPDRRFILAGNHVDGIRGSKGGYRSFGGRGHLNFAGQLFQAQILERGRGWLALASLWAFRGNDKNSEESTERRASDAVAGNCDCLRAFFKSIV